MYHISGMDLFESHGQLPDIKSGLFLSEVFPPSDEFIESLVDTEFQQQVNVILGFEGLNKTYNMLVGSLMWF